MRGTFCHPPAAEGAGSADAAFGVMPGAAGARGALFADQAERWIGTPYVPQQRTRAGCDCKGLIAGVAAELGFSEAASVEALAGDYGAVIDARRLRAGLARLFDRVEDLQRGDVLLVRTGGKPQHLAVFAPGGRGGGLRVIEAMHRGPQVVRPFRRRADEIDSIWRWKEQPSLVDRTNVAFGSMPPVSGVHHG